MDDSKEEPQGIISCGVFQNVESLSDIFQKSEWLWRISGEMNAKKKRNWLSSAIAALLGLACALVLGVVFYGAMAYQLLDDDGGGRQAAYEGARLALTGAQLVSEQTVAAAYGGENCTVLMRTYALDGGVQAEAITAQPAAYVERLSAEGYTPQLITGFVLAGLDAVYALRGGDALLCARSGDTVFMLRAAADEQTVYSLGAGAILE